MRTVVCCSDLSAVCLRGGRRQFCLRCHRNVTCTAVEPRRLAGRGGLAPPGPSSMASVVLLPDELVHRAHGKEAILWETMSCGPTFLCSPAVSLSPSCGTPQWPEGTVTTGEALRWGQVLLSRVSSGRWVCPRPSRGLQVFPFSHSVLYRAQAHSLSGQGGRSGGPCGRGLALGADTPQGTRRDDCDPRLPGFSLRNA